jgi:hypothetical protein
MALNRRGRRGIRARTPRGPAAAAIVPCCLAAEPRCAPRGPTAGPARSWVGPSGSAQLDRIGFPFLFFNFLKYIFITKRIPE